MKKIICIGECSLNIIFDASGMPLGAMPGGRVVNAAAMLTRSDGGLKVLMASDASTDGVGDTVVDFLARAGVDTSVIDRFTDGRTPINVITEGKDGARKLTRYEAYPEQQGFDIVWPRVDEGDVVVYGGFYAIDPRNRMNISRFLSNAREMKATLIYLPGYLPVQEPRITRVMPGLLENLEVAHMVITRTDDLMQIFGSTDAETVFKDRVSFYCPAMINVDPAGAKISYYSYGAHSELELEDGKAAKSLLWNAGALAGIVRRAAREDFAPGAADDAPEELRMSFLESALQGAREAESGVQAAWQMCE